jgi:hypothetical protein
MVVQLPDTRPRDVVITYITDAPAWKPTYRVMVGKDGKLRMQGWAVIDNTSGEDWRDVRVGVGSSSALSFRYDLRSIRRVHREQLGDTRYFVQAPPQGGGVDEQHHAPRVVAQFHDDLLALPSGHPARSSYDQSVAAMDLAPVFENATAQTRGSLSHRGGRAAKGETGGTRTAAPKDADKEAERRLRAEQARIARRRQQLAANESRIRKLAEDLKKKGQRVVIEGHAAEAEPKPDAQTGKAPMTDAAPVGESDFESRTALTVARGTSAMVSVVHDTTEGEIVYLYEPDGKRGDRRYAFRAVRFRNPIDSTLEALARDEGGAVEGGAVEGGAVEGGAVAGGADEGADRKATAHPLAEPLRALAKLQRERERLREEILSHEARRREFHARARELHMQIASPQLVRTARNLMRHLERKMKDATDRIQDATVAIVDRKEALMLARIKFEDELAELRWSAPSAEKT